MKKFMINKGGNCKTALTETSPAYRHFSNYLSFRMPNYVEGLRVIMIGIFDKKCDT